MAVIGQDTLGPQNPSAPLCTHFPVPPLFIQDRSFCFVLVWAFWSLIYILCTFFFLKLPKILHKGKLCSLFYALSDEAKYPLIVDQRRQKQLEAVDDTQAPLTRGRQLPLHRRINWEDQVGNGAKVLTFFLVIVGLFLFFFFFSALLPRPKLLLVKEIMGLLKIKIVSQDWKKEESPITEKKMNVCPWKSGASDKGKSYSDTQREQERCHGVGRPHTSISRTQVFKERLYATLV